MTDPLRPPGQSTFSSYPVTIAGHVLHLKQVGLGDAMAAEAEGDPSPWWAHVWPAGVRLADRILKGPRLDGLDVLDLGAGSGIVGVAAGIMGARVTFADASPSSLELARENAQTAGLQDFQVLQMDWDTPPPLRFPRVYAADVLYDQSHFNGVAGAFHRLLAPDGEGYIADPKRQPLPRLFGALMDAGLAFEILEEEEELLLMRLTHAVA